MGELLKELKSQNAAGHSWGEIAGNLYPSEDREYMRVILYRIANDDYYPTSNKVRARLNIPLLRTVEECPDCNTVHINRCPKVEGKEIPNLNHNSIVVLVGPGDIPPGAQAIAARPCPCDQWFIPNTPTRRKCFICSPFKGKVK